MNNDNQTRFTDVQDFIQSLRAGVFENKIAAALSDVALGVVTTGKKGTVSLTFSLSQIGQSNQVNCSHKIAFVTPTKTGSKGEEDTTDTPLHVNRGGRLTLFPENQHQMFDRHGLVTSNTQKQEQ